VKMSDLHGVLACLLPSYATNVRFQKTRNENERRRACALLSLAMWVTDRYMSNAALAGLASRALHPRNHRPKASELKISALLAS
jgi:hypothetical protein